MDRTLTHFIAALRNADIRISPAETLDAMSALELVGYRDRAFLKNSLALVLPKTADEKETFDSAFDQFFSFEDVSLGSPGGDGDPEDEREGAGEGEGQQQAKAAAAAKAGAAPRASSQHPKRTKTTSAPARCPSHVPSLASC